MNRIVLESKVGDDGMLQLAVPVGTADAGQDVLITVDPMVPKSTTQEEWKRFIDSTAGAWKGDFERPEQGEYEVRDELS